MCPSKATGIVECLGLAAVCTTVSAEVSAAVSTVLDALAAHDATRPSSSSRWAAATATRTSCSASRTATCGPRSSPWPRRAPRLLHELRARRRRAGRATPAPGERAVRRHRDPCAGGRRHRPRHQYLGLGAGRVRRPGRRRQDLPHRRPRRLRGPRAVSSSPPTASPARPGSWLQPRGRRAWESALAARDWGPGSGGDASIPIR